MNPLRGILCKVLSVSVFTLMAVAVKLASDKVPPGQIVFFRSFFAIPVILGWLAWTRNLRHGLDTARPMGHFWRGLVGTTAMGLGFTALGLLPLPEATVIGYAAPLLTVIFAAMFLNEEVRAFRLTAVFIGLAGVVIVMAPRLTVISTGAVSPAETAGALTALLAAVFAALAQVFIRRMVHTEATAAIVFYFSVTSTLLSLLTIPFGWAWPSPEIAVLLVAAGICGGVGQILLTEAYRAAPASVVAPFEYVSMLFAIVFGYLIFTEIPTRQTLAGAGLIVVAGLFILWRERKLGLQRAASRGAVTPQG